MFANRSKLSVVVVASLLVAWLGAFAADNDKGDKPTGDQPRISGKVIVVGPDGKEREVELGREGQGGENAEMIRRAIRVIRQGEGGKYMIGVSVAGEPISDLLRSQLNLGEDVGLAIAEVFPDSPAEKAGFKKHDILVSTGDQKISTLAGLAELVQAAGKEGKTLSLAVIRGGKTVTVAVKPEERKGGELKLDLPNVRKLPIENEEIRELIEKALKDGKLGRLEIEKLIPEEARQQFRIIRSRDQELKNQIDELNQRVSELEKAINALRK